MTNDPMKNQPETQDNDSGFRAVFRQSLILGVISAVLVALVHPLLILIGNNTDLYDYTPLRFILGSVYGWLLGIGNFVGMAASLIMLTSSKADRTEGQKRAQAMYMGRLVILLLFAVGGCFIPVFHPAAILVSLAATQFGIFAYSLTFKLAEAKKRAKSEKNPTPEELERLDKEKEQQEEEKDKIL